MKFFWLLSAALLLGSGAILAAEATAPAATAAASGNGQVGPRWMACSTEINKFCTDIEHGKGKMRACLEAHAADLSDPCKAAVAEHKAQHPN